MKSRIRIASILFFSLSVSACISVAKTDSTPLPSNSPLVIDTANTPNLAQVLEKLPGERLIYVSETHVRNADHLLQLAVLRALPPQQLVLGVEWFQARFQPVLDAFIAGTIDEAEMLLRTEYFDRWGFDYRLYRPIVLYAREHGIPIIALNASRELTQEISASGIEGLQGKLKEELPDGYDFSDQTYDRHLREVFSQHAREDQRFQRFLEVQLTWDETMAQNVARQLQQHDGKQVLVLAGRGHIGGRHGIPNRVTRRTGERGVIVSSYTPGLSARAQADYLVLNDEQPLPPKGLMGAMLDVQEDRIEIEGLTPGSAAEEAGVERGDLIVAVDGQEASDFTRFKLLMMDKQPGDRVSLRVVRKGLFGREKEVDFDFELKASARQGMGSHGK